ncbi:uncharacterized protein LOC120542863 [Polypterus senegalus]|uniref:uncharacterized protein LOC120542863 n=1 Tax=Polypterus senegalus TaxID=55291 RepID=UPI001965D296|nr:uncharacterized protein LOC120542863 [Polypterus senegalus]
MGGEEETEEEKVREEEIQEEEGEEEDGGIFIQEQAEHIPDLQLFHQLKNDGHYITMVEECDYLGSKITQILHSACSQLYEDVRCKQEEGILQDLEQSNFNFDLPRHHHTDIHMSSGKCLKAISEEEESGQVSSDSQEVYQSEEGLKECFTSTAKSMVVHSSNEMKEQRVDTYSDDLQVKAEQLLDEVVNLRTSFEIEDSKYHYSIDQDEECCILDTGVIFEEQKKDGPSESFPSFYEETEDTTSVNNIKVDDITNPHGIKNDPQEKMKKQKLELSSNQQPNESEIFSSSGILEFSNETLNENIDESEDNEEETNILLTMRCPTVEITGCSDEDSQEQDDDDDDDIEMIGLELVGLKDVQQLPTKENERNNVIHSQQGGKSSDEEKLALKDVTLSSSSFELLEMTTFLADPGCPKNVHQYLTDDDKATQSHKKEDLEQQKSMDMSHPDDFMQFSPKNIGPGLYDKETQSRGYAKQKQAIRFRKQNPVTRANVKEDSKRNSDSESSLEEEMQMREDKMKKAYHIRKVGASKNSSFLRTFLRICLIILLGTLLFWWATDQLDASSLQDFLQL